MLSARPCAAVHQVSSSSSKVMASAMPMAMGRVPSTAVSSTGTPSRGV
ncbi:MAG: hypothetical protein QM777_04035 [Pseudorhodoferax sp.]